MSNNALTPVDYIVMRKMKTMFVILVKGDDGKLNLIADPGLNRPFMVTNKRRAEQVAHDANGMAATWEEAFNLLKKDHPELEKDLVKIIEKGQKKANLQSKYKI